MTSQNSQNTVARKGPKRTFRRYARLSGFVITAAMATACVTLVAGCAPMKPAKFGTLVLGLDSAKVARTVQPSLDMNVDSYDIRGAGPAGATFNESGVSGSTLEEKSLSPGAWQVIVDAYNADSPPTRIGTGSVSVTVQPGQVATASVSVLPLAGAGTLRLAVDWPDGVVANPTIAATLTSASDGTSQPVNFGIAGSQAEYSSDTVPAGFYTLTMQLLDGSSLLWGDVEAVRIVAAEQSSGTFTLQREVNRGGLALAVSVDMAAQVPVTLSGVPSDNEIDQPMTVTANAASARAYIWYLNGVPYYDFFKNVASTYSFSPTMTFGRGPYALKPGPNTVSVVVEAASSSGPTLPALGSASATFNVTDLPGAPGAVDTAQTYCTNIGLKNDGTLWWWGHGFDAVCADPATRPSQMQGGSNWQAITSGVNIVYGIMSDGTLWVWGDNNDGDIGTGTTSPSAGIGISGPPVEIGTDSDWKEVWADAADPHVLALKSDGTLWAWGNNSHGQLGDGTMVNQDAPEQIGTDTDWASIAGGNYAALKTDGTLWQIGSVLQPPDGSYSSQTTPVQIGTASDWKSVAPGYAIKNDGTLWAWPTRASASSPFTFTPVQIGTDTDWASVWTDVGGAAAIKTNGTIWSTGVSSWSNGGSGVAGTPTQIGAASDWARVTPDGHYIKTNGSIWDGATAGSQRIMY